MQLYPDKYELRLQWLYLNKQRKGIGTKIINELIQFCSNNDIESLVLSPVSKNNIISQKFCESFNISKKIEKTESYYYVIRFATKY